MRRKPRSTRFSHSRFRIISRGDTKPAYNKIPRAGINEPNVYLARIQREDGHTSEGSNARGNESLYREVGNPSIEARISREARVSRISGRALCILEHPRSRPKEGPFGRLTSRARIRPGSREPSGSKPAITETSTRRSAFAVELRADPS